MPQPQIGVDYGEMRLGQRPDGWYVEIEGDGGVYSAGPTTEEKAREVLAEAQAVVRRAAN